MDRYDKFIEKARAVHGDKYSYGQVEYENSAKKVCILCPEHGEFWQAPSEHLRGKGCPVCANSKKGRKTMTTEEFVQKAVAKHGNRYKYNKTAYKGPSVKVTVTCPVHGDFEQLPYSHLQGSGCPKCGGFGKTSDDIVSDFRQVHGWRYDYSKVEYKGAKTPVTIICPEHGEFQQTPQKHLKAQGCPVCGRRSGAVKRKATFEEFVEKATQVHGGKYKYSREEYSDMHTKTRITCPKHGDFEQLPYDHVCGHGCPSCSNQISSGEELLYGIASSCVGVENIIRNDRGALNGKELDLFIPSLGVAFEYNGCHWHSESSGKGRFYHLDKTRLCEDKGIKLFHVFEDELSNRKDIVESKIKRILGCGNQSGKIYARDCTVSEITSKKAKPFLESNHIQGFARASVHVGCFSPDGALVGVMSFKNAGGGKHELVRFACDKDKVCPGVGGKLFSWFVKQYNPLEVKTFADRRWTPDASDNLYTKIGFELDGFVSPDYSYVMGGKCERRHKFGFRKSILSKKYGFPPTMTESEMCAEIGADKVWDCGKWRYMWKRKTVPNLRDGLFI